MNELEIQQEMYNKAIDLIQRRYPIGWGGAAVVYTTDGKFFTSVALETIDSNVELCIEVGAMCEAAKYDVKITHCLCITRENEYSTYKTLTPCGICQERLRYNGLNTMVGVTTKDNTLKFVPLNELQPYHWTEAFSDIEFFDDRHTK